MNQKIRFSVFAAIGLLISTLSYSQDSSVRSTRPKVAIFTPLYLDSAFDASYSYRYGKKFPKFINPGLEFYEGIQLAIDSLDKEGVKLDVFVYDSKSASSPINSVVKRREFENIDLVIGHVSPNEAKLLADVGAKQNVPFINVNYPNDAGVTNNPNYVVLNSTLKTHFSELYKFLQKNFNKSEILVFRKKGIAEDRLLNYLKDFEKTTNTGTLKLKYVELSDYFSSKDLVKYLDSSVTNIVMAGSLNADFGQRLAQDLAALNETYPITLFGMPNWDGFDFTKPEYKDLEIYYGTPFYANPSHRTAESIDQMFRSVYYSRPSDMVFRGFESMYRFGKLLSIHGKNVGSSLSDKRFNIFTDYNIQPVINPKTMTLDYFENQKIYFVKTLDGVVRAVY